MKNQLQDIHSIAPMAEAGQSARPTDPVQADYEEGKRFLGDGNYAQAAVSMHNALLGFQERGDEAGIANSSNQLGHICLAKQDLEQALNHYTRAWEIIERLEDPTSLMSLEKKFVLVYRGLKQFRQALDYCLNLLDRYHANNDPQGTVTVLEDMAEIYLESGQKDKAADAFRTIAAIHKNFKHQATAEVFFKKARELEEAA